MLLQNALELDAAQTFAEGDNTPITRGQAANMLYEAAQMAAKQEWEQTA